jgi:aspartate/methionine/tyrosine aminotransferase
MKLNPFRIEEYYGKYEFTAKYLLSNSDAQSRSIGELLDLEPTAREQFESQWCGYTEAPGAPYLREAIANIYDTVEAKDILVCSCAEEGIFLLYHTLLSAGDHAIIETPCYESALELARSTGAEISIWQRHFEDGWAHDVKALEQLIKPNTKVIYINTPSNPTGLLMPRNVFDAITNLARDKNIMLFCDEVYRELEHDPTTRLPAACDMYENAVSLGSMSKTYGLPGLRLGWFASRNTKLLEKLLSYKYYTTICNSAPSEFLSALALRNRDVLMKRNLEIIHQNLPLLESFLERHKDVFEWVKPNASPIGFPRFKLSQDVMTFCEEVVKETSVLLLPGSVYDEPNHLRIGYGRSNMPEALARLETYLVAKTY